VNNYHWGTPEYHGAPLEVNTNPRNGRPALNTTAAAFTTESLGRLGNVPGQFFFGPGINTFDLTLSKMLKITEFKIRRTLKVA